MENVVIFEERTYLSADKRTQIHGYIWRPEGIPLRGIIQISHGMCEYIKRYDAWARRFCEIGFVVCGNDHLGHGETAENAEELGFIPQKIGADCLVEDLHAMSQLIKAEYPELPLVLYGHSMGSFVLRAYLSRYGEELSAALISGTAGAGQPTAVAKKLAQTIAAVKGDHHRSKLLTSLAFGAYNKRFEDEQDRRSWLTRENVGKASLPRRRYARAARRQAAAPRLRVRSPMLEHRLGKERYQKRPVFRTAPQRAPQVRARRRWR